MTLRYTFSLLAVSAIAIFSSCDDSEKENFRPSIDAQLLTKETPYSPAFVDLNNVTTVDLTAGNNLHRMFQALNYQSTASVSGNLVIDAAKLNAMFSNTGNPFSDITTSTINVDGDQLNGSGINIKDYVASSLSDTEAANVRSEFEGWFTDIAAASNSVNQTASKGVAGKLGNYLVDEKGIEIAQVIQKSLIGALELDYIGNVLMDEGLTADNSKAVDEENYTALEHNWDIAYGLLTLNQVYLLGSTDATRGTVEFGAGSYIWEYNKENFDKFHLAFLNGRAAIVNNDRAELEAQATFIRTQIEKTIANAALGYLGKWKTGETDAARAHAIGEGIGFIYSLRFAKMHEADAAFSDAILDDLIDSEFGFWDLTTEKVNAASNAIKTKFGL
jgi:hypothetical protein